MNFNELVSDVLAFRHYLKAERGMAENTVLAYGHDLDRFAGWAAHDRKASRGRAPFSWRFPARAQAPQSGVPW